MNARTDALVSIAQTLMRYLLVDGVPSSGDVIRTYVALVNHALALHATPNEEVLARVELERRMIPTRYASETLTAITKQLGR